ncbi:MAG: hypothetical protein ACOVKN_04700 [Arenimonas sp.]
MIRISCIHHRTLALLLAILFPMSAMSACTWSEPGRIWDYTGSIDGKYPVRMSLVFSAGDLSGLYVYASQLRDIRVSGRIAADGSFQLAEYGSDGRISARFNGRFPERDPQGRYGDSTLACEVMVGQWQSADGKRAALPFYLAAEGSISGKLSNRYGAIGAVSNQAVHAPAERFWRALKAGDRNAVAAEIRYPIKVILNGKVKTLRNTAELLAVYDAVFTPAYRKAIGEAIPRNMFVRDQGAMLGSGQVWFGANGKVITLNNY